MAGKSGFGQFVRFVIVGCANTAVGFGAILAMKYGIGVSDLLANLLGYAVGISVSFLLNRSFTFGDRGAVGPAIIRFAISAGIAYLINVAVLLFFLSVLEAPSPVSQLAGVIAYTIAFFFLAKLFAFAGRPSTITAPRVERMSNRAESGVDP